jgi:hypothetical protein
MGQGGGTGTGAASDPETPQSRAAFIRLCDLHGDIQFTRQDSRDAGHCQEATDLFIERYLDGRSTVLLRDLMPFIRRGHEYWTSLLDVVEYKLALLGILSNEYRAYGWERVKEPARKRIVNLDSL